MRSSILALVVLVAGLNALGQAAQPFDVAAAGSNTFCGITTTWDTPYVEFYNQSDESDTDIRFLAPGGSGRVLALTHLGSRIFEIRPDLTRTPLFSGIDGTFGEGLVADAAGNMYLAAGPNRLVGIRPDGTIRVEYALDAYTMDLAADQCTLFYTTRPTLYSLISDIRRFDVCTGTPLPDFATGVSPSEIKLLPDGGLLRLGGNPRQLIRHDASGGVTRTYPVDPGSDTLALGRGGSTVLVGYGCTSTVRELDLDTGAILRTLSFDYVVVFHSLVAYNGFTAALGPLAAPHAAASVPALSTVMLGVLGALLAVIAVRRLM